MDSISVVVLSGVIMHTILVLFKVVCILVSFAAAIIGAMAVMAFSMSDNESEDSYTGWLILAIIGMICTFVSFAWLFVK